jgi:hypothetical protein
LGEFDCSGEILKYQGVKKQVRRQLGPPGGPTARRLRNLGPVWLVD